MYPKVHDLTYPLPEVDIRVHCLYGTGKETDEGYVYDVPKFDASPPPAPKKVVKGPGDGTVNLRSLEACRECASFDTCTSLRSVSVAYGCMTVDMLASLHACWDSSYVTCLPHNPSIDSLGPWWVESVRVKTRVCAQSAATVLTGAMLAAALGRLQS